MADVENQQDSSFPVKRKSDLCCQEQDNVANKAQKLDQSSNSADSESKHESSVENLKIGTESSTSLAEAASFVPGKDENCVPGVLTAGEKQDGGDEEEEDEEEEDLIEAEIDRKGKGISREDKGKGKMIEVDESDDSDDDDDDDEDGDEYDESDLSDDPLAEVDLDNILPSRTRRRSFQPGVYISNDRSGNHEDDDDDDSSDDSDA